MEASRSQDAVYKLGKVNSKYLIFDILSYVYDDYQKICNHLHKTSITMRQLLVLNYFPLKNMLLDTHVTFEATLPLIYNFKTSRSAHKLLEKIVQKKCNEAKTTWYWLIKKPSIVFRVANTKDREYLMQAELRAIYNGY